MLRSTEISSDTLLVSSVAGDGGGGVLGRKHVPQVDKYVSNRLSKNAIKTFYLLDQLEKLECAKAAYLLLPLLHFGYLS